MGRGMTQHKIITQLSWTDSNICKDKYDKQAWIYEMYETLFTFTQNSP